ncbi:MAG: hypothetical protein ACXVRW_14960, partial [Solirubrobacteraceae bacterium]
MDAHAAVRPPGSRATVVGAGAAIAALVAAVLALVPLAGAARADTIAWDAPVLIDPASPAPLNAISCPSAQLCLAVDGNGDLVSSSDPTGGAPTWTTADIDGSSLGLDGLTAISCPSTSFCAAVFLMGNVLTTTTPGTPTARWSVAGITANPLSGISCPSTRLCVAVDQSGN